jgi:hypothetical protein
MDNYKMTPFMFSFYMAVITYVERKQQQNDWIVFAVHVDINYKLLECHVIFTNNPHHMHMTYMWLQNDWIKL